MAEADLDLFIGSKSSYEKYKKDNNIRIEEEPEEEEKEKKPKGNVSVLSKETLTTLDEETVTMLRRTRTVHDFNTVYMQSSLEFYDEFYNDEDASEELKAARQIRRVYKVYIDYLNAVQIRNDYIDSLVEKYGGEDEFQKKMSMGMVKDWIPLKPVLSKKCPEYELYLSGMLPVTCETLSEEEINKIYETNLKEMEGVEAEIDYQVEDHIGNIGIYDKAIEKDWNNYGYNGSSNKSVTITDLQELNNIFDSWYKPESKDKERILFKNAPENIRARFEEERAYEHPGLLSRIANGEEIEPDEIDVNEMVRDPKTGRTMSRQELMQRETIRFLAQSGWSESRLLNYSNVGKRLGGMKRKKKVGRKRKRPSTEAFEAMNSPTGLDPVYSDNEYMSSAFLSIMRGEDD